MKEYTDLSAAVLNVCGAKVNGREAVSGGDINRAYALALSDGGKIFMKENRKANSDFFRAEEEGLAAMRATGAVRVPEVLARGTDGDRAFLLLEYIESGRQGTHTMEELGRALAAMHAADTAVFLPAEQDADAPGGLAPVPAKRDAGAAGAGPLAPHACYGFLSDNYIGAGYQINTPKDSWVTFFRDCRLAPQFARAAGYFNVQEHRQIERFLDHLDQYLPEPEKPSLLHGDLWGGNYMIDREGNPWLIDPAAYVGHAEADIAMTELFGGFGDAFYGAYREAGGLAPDYAERRDLYNLYHLLNHLNLFGGGYLSAVKHSLGRYY